MHSQLRCLACLDHPSLTPSHLFTCFTTTGIIFQMHWIILSLCHCPSLHTSVDFFFIPIYKLRDYILTPVLITGTSPGILSTSSLNQVIPYPVSSYICPRHTKVDRAHKVLTARWHLAPFIHSPHLLFTSRCPMITTIRFSAVISFPHRAGPSRRSFPSGSRSRAELVLGEVLEVLASALRRGHLGLRLRRRSLETGTSRAR